MNTLLLHIPLFLVNYEWVVFLQRMLIEKSPIFLVNTLLLFCSHQHSFTPYPSLSPYWRTDRITDRGTNTLGARGLEELFFQLCCCLCQFLVLAGNRFWFYILTYLEYNTVVALCEVFWFWREIVFGVTYVLSVQYSCAVVSLLVVAGNSSQNENTFWILIGWDTLLWSASRCVYFIRPNTLLLCIFLFCIFILYRADPQVEVQIRILLKDKYVKLCQNANTGNHTLNNAYWVSLS